MGKSGRIATFSTQFSGYRALSGRGIAWGRKGQ
jgi:hypothetical protein